MTNGCDDNGWDLYESQTREEFEFYAMRKGYDITGFTFFYKDSSTQALWEAYHKGNVSGREWKKEEGGIENTIR